MQREWVIGCKGGGFAVSGKEREGFTLIELLVVLAIVSVLTGILLPVAMNVRRRGRVLLCMQNQRTIVRTADIYAMDNDGRYPESVAKIGMPDDWHWDEPWMLTGYDLAHPGPHRAMSAYLRRYIKDADIMFCPSAPSRYQYLQEAWDLGDDWMIPETPRPDPLLGTYCFYWNYKGFIGGRRVVFKGPLGSSYRRGHSRLLVTDYFGFNHWRSRNAYGSSERFEGAGATGGTPVSSAFWSISGSEGDIDGGALDIKLHAGYTDGHVGVYLSSETAPMWVSLSQHGGVPRTNVPGIFYLPQEALN